MSEMDDESGVLSEAQVRILRRMIAGRVKIPKRDDSLADGMEACGLIDSLPGTWSAPDRRRWALTAVGIAALIRIDGPLTERERSDWLTFPKTRFGRDGEPQKLLSSPHGPRWTSFDILRARHLMEKWSNEAERERQARAAVSTRSKPNTENDP